MLIDDLRRRAYFGVGAALSLGQDTTDASFQVRAQTMPGLARFFTAGRGITAPEPGRTTAPYWVTSTAEARKAVQENAAKKVDIIKIWVDDRMGAVKKLSPELYAAVIDEAHKNRLRVNGAQFLRMTNTGTIEPNNSADFIVLDANPLDDITNTRKISSVYLRGASVDRSSYK